MVLRVASERSTAGLRVHARSRRAPLPIAAAAMIGFELDERGICGGVSLCGVDRHIAGERALIVSVERRLAALHRANGRLVTFGGSHDLTMIRLGSLRHRDFSMRAATAWLQDVRDAHDDVLEMIDATGAATAAVTRFMAGICGRSPSFGPTNGPDRRERAAAEFEAVQALTAYLFLIAERHGSIEPLSMGVAAIAEMVEARASASPHLASILRSDLFEMLAPPIF